VTRSTSQTILYSLTALIGTAAGLSVLLYFSIQHWFGPWTPAILFSGGVALPVCVLQTILALLRDDTDRDVREILKPALMPTLVILLLGQGLTVAWNHPRYRKVAFDEAVCQIFGIFAPVRVRARFRLEGVTARLGDGPIQPVLRGSPLGCHGFFILVHGCDLGLARARDYRLTPRGWPPNPRNVARDRL